MRDDAQQRGKPNGVFSLRAISGYLRVVSSGASTVASTVRSASASVASSLAEDDSLRDQVLWAGFDKIEWEDNALRQVLLLCYRSGFEVWDVQDADDVRKLASRRDGPVSFLQLPKKPVGSKRSEDKFAEFRPLLVVAGDSATSGGLDNYDGNVPSANPYFGGYQEQGNGNFVPTSIHFYSLKTHAFVHVLKFRSAIYAIRCSPRVVAVLQAAQIHCFDAATLENEYTILTYPMVPNSLGSGGVGYGPLAVGSRWLAYSGSPVAVSSTGRVSPQHLTAPTSLSSPLNGNLVAHYAKESSKQLASGIVTLGDIGYKKLSKYYSEVRQDGGNSMKQRNSSFKVNGKVNGRSPDENAGMVIVRDFVSRSVVVQFRAHTSPISALCFDPSGTLLVTASVHGNNFNIFGIMPSTCGKPSGADAAGSYVHLYKLQRGFTNAVIQDISFSDDSEYIMISSSRGTSHLFALSQSGGSASHNLVNGSNGLSVVAKTPAWRQPGSNSRFNPNNFSSTGRPITLSVVSRIRNGSNGWKGAVSGAAAAATGRVSPLCGAVASVFHNCKGAGAYPDLNSLKTKYYLLVFSPSGSVIQYLLRHSNGAESVSDLPGLDFGSRGLSEDGNTGFVVEALQKWDICHKKNRRDHGDDIDVYGENGSVGSTAFSTRRNKKGNTITPIGSRTLTTDEKHHLYISEVELRTHPVQVPLWARRNICFQMMNETADFIQFNTNTLDGEIEIERVPTRTIEARSKDLVPAFDYLQMPRFQYSRTGSVQSSRNGSLASKKFGSPEDISLSCRSSCGSVDYLSEGAAAASESPSTVENVWNNQQDSPNVVENVWGDQQDSPNVVENGWDNQQGSPNVVKNGWGNQQSSANVTENGWGDQQSSSNVVENGWGHQQGSPNVTENGWSNLQGSPDVVESGNQQVSPNVTENGWGNQQGSPNVTENGWDNRQGSCNLVKNHWGNLHDFPSADENGWHDQQESSKSTVNCVNNTNSLSIKTQPEPVNNSGDLNIMAEPESVNNAVGLNGLAELDCNNVDGPSSLAELHSVNNAEGLNSLAELECVYNAEGLNSLADFEYVNNRELEDGD